MTQTDTRERAGNGTATQPMIVVSADCHIGPRIVEDLRPYCPRDLLDDFDAYLNSPKRARGRFAEPPAEAERGSLVAWRNLFIDGHHDPAARLRDFDHDGVAAEVIFHGSQNGEPIPWQTSMLGAPDDPGLAAAGMRIYNRWLADYCSDQPERHVGLAYLPLWDIEASVAEVAWAREAGLKGVNFAGVRPGVRPYNDRAWEPFWAACADLRMPLTTHAGAGDPSLYTGPESTALLTIESGGWMARRAMHLLIFAGVFERHPDLQLVLTEQPGQWWSYTLNELDSVHMGQGANPALLAQVPRRPSEYAHSNVWIGASFLSRAEAEGAFRDGYADRVLWGSDYPHMEGTFQFPPSGSYEDGFSFTKAALRFTLAGLPEPTVRGICGLNAARVYGLDVPALSRVAERIGAPSFEEVSEPLAAVPEGASRQAFRTFGPWS